jgi:ComF family protein
MQQFLDILFPSHCAGCQRSGYVLCPSCIAQIHPLPSPFCQHCGAPLPPGGKCKNCQYYPLSMSGLRAVSAYQEPLRACIHALKYNGNTRLAEPLGQLLARAYTSYGLHADIIIPVPLHSERQRQRGYNHASLLARVCSTQLGIPLHENILVRHRATLAQVDLNPKDRYQNVAGAFHCTVFHAQILASKPNETELFSLFPAVRHILLPLLLKIYVSTILLSDAQHHRASTACIVGGGNSFPHKPYNNNI